jgi:hypothetical protein
VTLFTMVLILGTKSVRAFEDCCNVFIHAYEMTNEDYFWVVRGFKA